VNVEELVTELREVQTHWMPRAMFVLVPVCAFLIAAVTRRSGRTYIQHLYFALHGHAAYFGGLTLAAFADATNSGLVNAASSLLLAVWIGVYSVVAFRTAYGGGWWASVARAAVVLALYTIIVGVAIVSLLFGLLFAASRT
jgi:hypothetical protein